MASPDVNSKLSAIKDRLEQLLQIDGNDFNTTDATCSPAVPQMQQLRDLLAKFGGVSTSSEETTGTETSSTGGNETTGTEETTPTPESSTSNKLLYEDEAKAKHGQAFIDEVRAMAGRLGMDPSHIMATMKAECNFDHTAVNPMSSATGLIQFMPSTARSLGTTVEAIRGMSAIGQLEYVEKYYKSFGNLSQQISEPAESYLLVFYPYAVGKPDSYVLGSHVSDGRARLIARQNGIYDLNKDGYVTKGEVMQYMRENKYKDAYSRLDDSGGTGTANSSLSGSVGEGGRNSEGDVRLVQELLNAKAGAGLDVDGFYGPNTLAAIKAFQEATFNGWSDGLIEPGQKTIQALEEGTTDDGTGDGTGDGTDDGTGGDTTTNSSLSGSVGEGGQNDEADVRLVQELLNAKAGAGLDVDGKYGPKTLAAIKAFQEATFNGWSDGLIEPGQNTIKALQGGSTDNSTDDGTGDDTDDVTDDNTGDGTDDTDTGDGTDDTTGDDTDTGDGTDDTGDTTTNSSLAASVGKGGQNDEADVRLVQELLNEKAEAGLDVDGKYGPRTLAAIEAFQRSAFNGWSDGLIEPGQNTIKTLESAEPGSHAVTQILDNSGNTGVGDDGHEVYKDQRDNPRMGDTTCNVTTLAMQLIALAGGDEARVTESAVKLLQGYGQSASTSTALEELLRQLTIHVSGAEYHSGIPAWQWSWVLDKTGEQFTDIASRIINPDEGGLYNIFTKALYEEKIVPALSQGAEVMLSNSLTRGGHIVFLVSVRNDGLVIHDPYGMMVTGQRYIRNGDPVSSHKSFYTGNPQTVATRLKLNTNLKGQLDGIFSSGSGTLPSNLGESNFYTWAEVSTYKIGVWCNIAYKA